MLLIHDIDIAIGEAKRWGMIKWKVELDICVYNTRASDPGAKIRPYHLMVANNLNDAMQILFDLSNRGYEIFHTCGNSGIVSILVQPSVDHSTNIDIEVLERISALFK